MCVPPPPPPEQVRSSECEPLYDGQPACDDVVADMRTTFGFSNVTACPSPRHVNAARFNSAHTAGCEDEIHFSTTGTYAVPEADEEHKARRAEAKAEGAAWLAAIPQWLRPRGAASVAAPSARALQAAV